MSVVFLFQDVWNWLWCKMSWNDEVSACTIMFWRLNIGTCKGKHALCIATAECMLILLSRYAVSVNALQFWCDFDRASSLICGNKMPTRCNRGFYCSTWFGDPYAHHQELKSIIQWLLPVVFRAVVFSSSWSGVELRFMCPVCRMLHTRPATRKNHSTKYHSQQPLYNTFELLMMGIVMPEICWANNKICNKNLCCI